MKKNLLILGAGCIARDVADAVEDFPEYELAGFVVDVPPYEPGQLMLGKPIYWIDDIPFFDRSYRAICAIGRMTKIRIIQKVQELGMPFVNLIHPTARVSRSASIGEGTFIGVNVQIGAFTKIDNHVFINRGVMIGSEVSIKEYSVISAGANIAGNVEIGASTFIGFGAMVLPHITVGNNCIVGAGAMVNRSFPDRVKVIGHPAEIIEIDIGGF